MAKHLRFDMRDAYESGATKHPQKVIKELGITYQHATPIMIADQWWFWNCENIPNPLPPYLEVADWNPMHWIGWPLSREDAEKIRDYKSVGNTGGQSEQLKCPNCKLYYDKEEIEMFRGLCESCRDRAFSF